MKPAPIREANAAYEIWLREQLNGDLVEADLVEKHEKMRESPLAFLRATYWRWAETITTICPGLEEAPPVLAVGDIHLENFGTWRDIDGRLVWGVNDLDEAAKMPYVFDLLRLATSACLAAEPAKSPDHDSVCTAIMEGYREGLARPRPFVLDEEHPWLRALVEVSDKARKKFWDKLDKLPLPDASPPKRYRKVLSRAMPDPDAEIVVRPRRAGTGSLGRPRWVGMSNWRGGRVVREAKALVASGWTRATKPHSNKLRCQGVAFGAYRAPDPWYSVAGTISVRRLSPNSRKIEVDDDAAGLLAPQMLHAMGHELASVHLGTADRREEIRADLAARGFGWLAEATTAAAASVRAEHEEWRGG